MPEITDETVREAGYRVVVVFFFLSDVKVKMAAAGVTSLSVRKPSTNERGPP